LRGLDKERGHHAFLAKLLLISTAPQATQVPEEDMEGEPAAKRVKRGKDDSNNKGREVLEHYVDGQLSDPERKTHPNPNP